MREQVERTTLRVYCLVTVLVILSAAVVVAQDDSASLATPKNQVGFIGVFGGVGMLLIDDGSGSQYRVGINSEIVIVRQQYGHLYLCGQLEYLNSTGDVALPIHSFGDPMDTSTVDLSANEHVQYSEAGVLLGLGVRSSWLSLDVSWLMDYMIQGMTESTMSISDPNDEPFDTTLYEPGTAEFRDDGRTMVVGRFALSDFNTWRMGVQIAPKARITFSPIQIVIAPSYRHYFNAIDQTNFTSTEMLAVDVSIGLML